jgi:hypothetical protein
MSTYQGYVILEPMAPKESRFHAKFIIVVRAAGKRVLRS